MNKYREQALLSCEGQNFCWRDAIHTSTTSCLLTPYREPTVDQSIDTTEVQLGEPMSYWDSLEECG